MSNQIVISSGAKVRSLEGVLTGTAGIVNSVPLGGANGVATLDSNGKVPLSQLPASVVTYLGTWNAATNTPTLANGTGDVGDLYICNVAGTVNFGAGPITFAVGDWVIYNGSQWQKSAGQNGTVTSVAVTSTGNDAISITGSPITTAGTINIGFTGDNTQYINGAGDLTTFPSLTGYVPYTGATTDVDLGAHVLNAQALHVKGTAGAGHLGLKHQSAAATGSANESLIYANVDGDLAWQNDNLYLTTLSTHANTANRVYTFPNASGTIALTSDISYPVTSVFGRTGAVTAQSGDYTTTLVTEGTNLYYTDARARGAISLTTTGSSGAATYNSTTGVLNVPNYGSALSGYVPYTGATADVDLGIYKISSRSLITTGTTNGGILLKQNSVISGEVDSQPYTSIKAFDTRYLYFDFGTATSYKRFRFDANGLTDGTTITYTMPNASGTLALTSDIPSLANYVTTNTNQTISGIKTFSNEQLFGNGITLTGGYITYTSGSFNLTLNTNLLTANRNVFLQDKAGTIALTSDLTGGTVTSVGLSSATSGVTIGSSPITTSGTITLAIATASGSQQGLLSSTDWTTFNNKQNALTNPVTGTGTSGYHAKFTGSTTLGNSMVFDDGTTLQSIGATRSNLYLRAASSSYYSQLAFTNGTNGSFGGLSYNNSGQYMQFETNSSEWMRLTSTGNLGIGTTSPTGTYGKLSVAGGISILDDNNAKLEIGRYSSGASNSYIKLGANSASLRITNNTDSADIFTITNSGNVGIGTSSPNAPLHILGANQTNGTAQLEPNSAKGTISSFIHYGTTGDWYIRSASTSGKVIINDTGGNVSIGTSSPANYFTTTLTIDGSSSQGIMFRQSGTDRGYSYWSSDFMVYGANTGGVIFKSADTERMRITSAGNVLVGTTTGTLIASTLFQVGASGGGGQINISGGYTPDAALNVRDVGNNLISFFYGGTKVGSVTTNGSTTSYNITSDYRLKEDFKEIKGLDKILSIKVYDFKWKDNDARMYGVIAHELQKVIPYAVQGEKDGEQMQSVDYSKLVPILVKAIQEQQAQIEELKALINK